jgi:hypothetical protein
MHLIGFIIRFLSVTLPLPLTTTISPYNFFYAAEESYTKLVFHPPPPHTHTVLAGGVSKGDTVFV